MLCVAFGERARGALASFLRDHGDPAMSASVLSVPTMSQDELVAGLGVAGIRAAVALAGRPGVPPWRALDELARGGTLDLVVLPRFASAVIRSARWPAPVLVLPPTPARRRVAERPLDVAGGVVLVLPGRHHVGDAQGDERDERDRTRSVSPLKPAEDAIIIDTSHLGIDEVFSAVLEQYSGCFGKE